MTSPVTQAPSDQRSNFLDIAIEAVLVMLLLFMPLAFGAVEPWSQMVASSGIALLAILLALRLLMRREAVCSWAFVPIVLYLLLVLLQLLPLPIWIVRILSPQTGAR